MMHKTNLGLILLAMACGKPTVVGDPSEDESGDDTNFEASGGSDEGGTADTSDTHMGGLDTAVAEAGAGSGGDESSDGGTGDSSGSDTGSGGESAIAMSDFQLEDLNPASPRYGETVSPRNYMEEISGWYFIKGS
jgi:hypothetical protein